ncbi:zinc finger protein 184-like [Gracilinanus agilis]|uniref:zinc finger protein 184-like n=1 Tax=Gracilinanus agilis TaxID=191870 RepID=UPI001CFCDEAE|nr:zinc finger protein 184-like [Gracilinanus agilis]
MASESARCPAQEVLIFKDFTQEEWRLLALPQKELYKEVMLENAWNLLSVGLAVSRRDAISHLEQREAPWMLEQEDLRNCCSEREIRPEMKATPAEVGLSVEETGPERFVSGGPDSLPCRELGVESQNPSLVGHQRMHPEEKPGEHNQCGKTFMARASLVPEAIHTGEKPHERKC